MTTQKVNEHIKNKSDVELIPRKSVKKDSGHEFYWHIFFNTTRAGKVYIDLIIDPIIGKHASIHIFLNKKNQGKGIGRIGYKKACELSGLPVIYAHMRKNNTASKKAALAAGFEIVDDERFTQLVMKWNRK